MTSLIDKRPQLSIFWSHFPAEGRFFCVFSCSAGMSRSGLRMRAAAASLSARVCVGRGASAGRCASAGTAEAPGLTQRLPSCLLPFARGFSAVTDSLQPRKLIHIFPLPPGVLADFYPELEPPSRRVPPLSPRVRAVKMGSWPERGVYGCFCGKLSVLFPRFEAEQLIFYSRCLWPSSALSCGTRSGASAAPQLWSSVRREETLFPPKPSV